MKKTRDGRRLFDRDFKVAAVRRVLAGEPAGKVARELGIRTSLLWVWKKRVLDLGEDHLYQVGARRGQYRQGGDASQERRIGELERLIGRQQAEIRFLGRALRRVEELRQEKNDDGGAASTKR